MTPLPMIRRRGDRTVRLPARVIRETPSIPDGSLTDSHTHAYTEETARRIIRSTHSHSCARYCQTC